MKNYFKNFLQAFILIMALSFTACQDEFEELPQADEAQTIVANSSTAKLIEKTASRDGSFDNIVDGASCLAIEFPYSVRANGVEITVETEEGLDLIEEIFEELESDDDILEIIFPIVITLADFTEIEIKDAEALKDLAKECIEGGDDDDIECIDFVYPITLYTFDINEVETGSVTVESDKDLRLFFANLDENDLISIDFPVTLELYDGSKMEVNSNAELANAIETTKEACDEDDDDDYNDDDFTQERLEDLLVECPWLIKEVIRDEVNQSDQYFEYVMNFKEDGSVTVKDRIGNDLVGEWSTRATDHGVLINLEFDVLVDFNLEWLVYELEEGKIKLFAEGGNKIIMISACDLFEADPDTLRSILSECNWIVKRVKNNGDHLNRLLGYSFEFNEGGVVLLSNEENVIEGTWAVELNNAGRAVLAITMGDEPGVSFEWLLSDLKDRYLKFNVEGTFYELVLVRNCEGDYDDDQDISFIRDIFGDTEWAISYFAENEDETTSAYDDVTLFMNSNGTIEVRDMNAAVISSGRWFLFRNAYNKLELIIAFEEGSNFYPLANDYTILEVDQMVIELKHENDGGGYDYLTLEQIM
ncbi:MAG: hypothetical protein WBN69_01530 [Eudoraea sp.]